MTALAGRWTLLRQLLVACGPFAPAAVAAGGLAAAFAVWQTAFAGTRGVASAGAFVVVALAAIVLAGLVWLWPCARAASRGATPLVPLLRYDAVAYAALVAYPAAQIVHPGPVGQIAGATIAIAGYVLGTSLAIARFHAGFRATLLVFGVSRVIVVIVAELAALFIGDRGAAHPASVARASLDVWSRWDGAHYLAIAHDGYRGANLAFFPLYPVLIRAVVTFAGNPVVAAIAISNVSLLVALAFLRRVSADVFDDGVASRAIFYTATFPTAVFFSAAYTESLFLALSVATFFYLRRRNWLIAGFLGGLAALTRVEGVLLLAPFAIEVFEHRRALNASGMRLDRASRNAPAVGALMIVFGLVTFMLLSALLSGDPLYFAHVQAHWNRHPAWPWASIERSLHEIVTSHDPPTLAVQSIELCFALATIALVVYGARLLPWSFTAYAACSLLVPLFTGSLMSTERFSLTLFPIFMVLGVAGRRPFVDSAIRTISLPLLGAFTLLFAAAYWIG